MEELRRIRVYRQRRKTPMDPSMAVAKKGFHFEWLSGIIQLSRGLYL